MRLGLQHTYSALPSRFYARVAPTPVKDPQLVVFNSRLASELDFDPAILERKAAELMARVCHGDRVGIIGRLIA